MRALSQNAILLIFCDNYRKNHKIKSIKLKNCRSRRALKILSLRMLVTVKQDNTLKARLVARGFLQREGINYFQTYSPVIRTASSRLLLQLAEITGKPLVLGIKQSPKV